MKSFPWILFTILLIVIAVLVGLLVVTQKISSDAVSAFIGVLMGTAVAGAIQYWTTEASHRHQLRVAALEKRLEVHQQAYTFWRKLLFARENTNSVVLECQDWWEKNCLYLSLDARDAFYKAYTSAHSYAALPEGPTDLELRESLFHDIDRAGRLIVEGVYLPSIGQSENKRV